MSMYKIKLRKGVRVEITVPNGTNTGETKVNRDDPEIIVDNRGEIISSALDMETIIDNIISSLFFDQHSDSKLFGTSFY
jgi:hypothetical protein